MSANPVLKIPLVVVDFELSDNSEVRTISLAAQGWQQPARTMNLPFALLGRNFRVTVECLDVTRELEG